MHDAYTDPYIDPSTGVLRNLIGAKTYDELDNAEGELVAVRIGEFLTRLPLKVTGSLTDFCAIHQYLFQDIYDWAGKPRIVEIRKNEDGSEFFLPSVNIETGFSWARNELVKDNSLQGQNLPTFAERLAYHYDNYNFIHPFREGNGRVQRLFWTVLCYEAGYELDWRKVSGQENDDASKQAAEQLDRSGLEAIFARIATPCNPQVALNSQLLPLGHLGAA